MVRITPTTQLPAHENNLSTPQQKKHPAQDIKTLHKAFSNTKYTINKNNADQLNTTKPSR